MPIPNNLLHTRLGDRYLCPLLLMFLRNCRRFMFLEPQRFLNIISKRNLLALSQRNSINPFRYLLLDNIALVFLVPPLDGVQRYHRRWLSPSEEIAMGSEEFCGVETEFLFRV